MLLFEIVTKVPDDLKKTMYFNKESTGPVHQVYAT